MNNVDYKRFVLAAVGIGAGMLAARAAFNRAGRASLRGQTVLITGGSRGLGIAMARAFAAEGCRIAICARDAEELENARRDLAGRGAECMAHTCDVSDRAQVDQLAAEVVRRFGGVDVLVNNAGEIQVGPVENMTVEDFERAMNVMFWGTVHPTLALLPGMLERGSGRIVNIGSIGGKVAAPHLLPYTCAKFAAAGFSEGLRTEMAGKGVAVVTIAPGLMRTGSYRNARYKGDAERESAWFGASASLPLLSMDADRAASLIVEAARRGDAGKILTTPAKVAARLHGAAPGLTVNLLGLVNRFLLPGPRRGGSRGRLASGPLFSLLTVLGREAARRFLQPQRRTAGQAG